MPPTAALSVCSNLHRSGALLFDIRTATPPLRHDQAAIPRPYDEVLHDAPGEYEFRLNNIGMAAPGGSIAFADASARPVGQLGQAEGIILAEDSTRGTSIGFARTGFGPDPLWRRAEVRGR